MNHKTTIIYIVVGLILINSAYAEQYFALSVNYIFDSLTFNSINLKELDRSIAYHDKSGFLIKVISFQNAELKKIYYNMSENKEYVIYLPYDKDASRIEVYNPANSKIMDLDVSSFADTCGNGICENHESYESCTRDCSSGSKDNFCDGVKDGICDPDCPAKLDADCKETNGNESIQAQKIGGNVKNTDIKNESDAEQSRKSGYLTWILYGAGIILIVLLALLFIKKRKENQVVDSLKQYVSENITRGFTLQQIKDVLHREGYNEKEIDKAVKTI